MTDLAAREISHTDLDSGSASGVGGQTSGSGRSSLVFALLRLNLVMSLDLPASREWTVGLSAWIVQDGNYDEFAVGDHAEFALDFYSHEGLARARYGTKHQAIQVAEDLYQITATVVHVGDHGWVLDFGLLAYSDTTPPDGVEVGQVLAGRATLGVDPFTYFEQLANDPRYPAMVYTWTIRSIGRETAPFVRHGNVWVRDESLRSRVDVPATNAWTDDDGHGDYVLRCELLPVPPQRTSASAR
jgi:hypothetical protein